MQTIAGTQAQQYGDIWAQQYGELLTKTQVAKMLGISIRTVYTRVAEGKYRTNADKRLIFTRSVAAYEDTGIPQGEATVSVTKPPLSKPKPRFYIERRTQS